MKEKRDSKKRGIVIGSVSLIGVAAIIAAFVLWGIPEIKRMRAYTNAISTLSGNDVDYSQSLFYDLGGYKDSVKYYVKITKYKDALAMADDSRYSEAEATFRELDGFFDSIQKADECLVLVNAQKLIGEGKLDEATNLLNAVTTFSEKENMLFAMHRDYITWCIENKEKDKMGNSLMYLIQECQNRNTVGDESMMEEEELEPGVNYYGYYSKPAVGVYSYSLTKNLCIYVYYADAKKTPYYYSIGYSVKDDNGRWKYEMYYYKLDGTYIFSSHQ